MRKKIVCAAGVVLAGFLLLCIGVPLSLSKQNVFLHEGDTLASQTLSYPVGACCFEDGSCQYLEDFDCYAYGGEFQGDGTDCTPNPCPQPGACCFEDGSCEFLLEELCDEAGGAYWIADEVCEPNPCNAAFIRGDANADGVINTEDCLHYMVAIETPDPPCWDAADFNDDGVIDLSDAMALLQFLFAGGAEPPPPYPDCGFDPTDDDLGCASFPPCVPDTAGELRAGPGLATIPLVEDDALRDALIRLQSDISADGRSLSAPILVDILESLLTTGDLGKIRAAGEGIVPDGASLHSPNPLQPGSVISFELPQDAAVSIVIYDVHGRKLRTLSAGRFSSGHHEVMWDGRTETSQEAGTGIYYMRGLLGSQVLRRTIALLR